MCKRGAYTDVRGQIGLCFHNEMELVSLDVEVRSFPNSTCVLEGEKVDRKQRCECVREKAEGLGCASKGDVRLAGRQRQGDACGGRWSLLR